MFIARRRLWVRASEGVDKDGGPATILEYGLLARGEDPRLAAEAQRLGELFTEQWQPTDAPAGAAAHHKTSRARSGPAHD